MVKTKEEILSAISTILGNNTDDTSLGFIEDITDTFNDYETRVSDKTDWKTKYEANDAEWRQKYRDRFFNTGGVDDKDKELPPDDTDKPKKLRFEDLFKEV